jgi:acyl carrier protein
MNPSDALENELKQLIVEVVNLEDVTAADIETDAPLFQGGLGLDSIDALELGMAVARKYGIQFSRDQDENSKHFQSVRTLALLVRNNATKPAHNQ